MPALDDNRDPSWIRATRLWLVGLTIGLVGVGMYVSRLFSRPLTAIVVFIVLLMGPFGHARLWLMRHLATSLSIGAIGGWALAILAAVFDAVMAAQLLTARTDYTLPFISGDVVGWVGPVWFSSHAIIFLAIVFAGPIARVRRWARSGSPAQPTSLERRDFLRGIGRAGVGLPFVVSLSGVETSYDFRVEEREVELPHWPPALDGLRVAHLSDIHVGGAMDLEKLTRVAELTNGAEPDIVLHTGDFLTHRLPGFDEPLYDALAQIRAPHGQWACLGNHDYDNPTRFVGRLAGCGVETLRNRAARLEIRGESVEIAGLEFAFYRPGAAERYAAAVAGLGPRTGTPRILLCHDPTAFATLPAGCADLVLSGHTHGGHVGVQVGDSALTVVGMLGFPDQGVFERENMKLYVTRCVGFYGYPIRLGIPPEIALLVLRSPGRAETT